MGKSFILAHTLMSLVLDLAKMVLVVQKHLRMTEIIILEQLLLILYFQKINLLGSP